MKSFLFLTMFLTSFIFSQKENTENSFYLSAGGVYLFSPIYSQYQDLKIINKTTDFSKPLAVGSKIGFQISKDWYFDIDFTISLKNEMNILSQRELKINPYKSPSLDQEYSNYIIAIETGNQRILQSSFYQMSSFSLIRRINKWFSIGGGLGYFYKNSEIFDLGSVLYYKYNYSDETYYHQESIDTGKNLNGQLDFYFPLKTRIHLPLKKIESTLDLNLIMSHSYTSFQTALMIGINNWNK